MKLTISHITEYRYDEPSQFSLQRLRLTPLTGIGQTVHDWKLTVEGHTDNIGGNKSNLDLSKRRSEAVVHELVNGYYISENRFTAATGFGASRPVDTNDTLQGRARNRRVELARQ